MKIDFELLDRLEAAGATAKVIIEMLKAQHQVVEAKRLTKRPKDAKRQRERRKATPSDKCVTPSDTERHEATLSDTPRARLFREGKPALLSLNIAPSRAGALIVEWLKITSDDEQLVLATILKAQSLAVAEAPGWILATLKGRTANGKAQDNPKAGSLIGALDRAIAKAEFEENLGLEVPADNLLCLPSRSVQ
jgi:hypothetical protein